MEKKASAEKAARCYGTGAQQAIGSLRRTAISPA